MVRSVRGVSDKIAFTVGTSRNPQKYADSAKELGVDLAESYDAVLRDPSVDAVVLATPHSLHREQIEAAAAAGKHVFCEKPLTLNRTDSEAACEAARRHGVVLAAGHNRRFHPAFVTLRDSVARGRLGNILHLEASMTSPGFWRYEAESWRMERDESPAGGMAAMGVHLIDAMISMVGRVRSVFAQSDRIHRRDGLDDMTSALLRFESGVTGYLGTSLSTEWCFDVRVFGDDGWAAVRNLDMSEYNFRPRVGEAEDFHFEPFDTERAELEAFADAVAGRARYPVSLDEVVHSTEVLQAVVESAASGNKVTLG